MQLHLERTYLGSTLGSLETWLLLRSLRTLHLRVPRQSTTATLLAEWLHSIAKAQRGEQFDGAPGGILARVTHSSLQGTDHRGFNPQDQMQGGWNATFAIYVGFLSAPSSDLLIVLPLAGYQSRIWASATSYPEVFCGKDI
jgi:hypothetical protein